MKKILSGKCFRASIFFALLFFVIACAGVSHAGPGLPRYRTDEVLVKMRPETGLAARTVSEASVSGMARSLGGLMARKLKTNRVEPGLYVLKLKPGEKAEDKVRELMSNPDVEYAQLNHIFHKTQLTPDDPDFSGQWGLPDIGMPNAWDITTGSPNIIVAVIDTGIDYNHPDLIPNLWTNPNPNGDPDYPNALHGINAIANNSYNEGYNNPGDPMDDDGHGTHVSGIIGAAGNNSAGISGVNWNASIMALKFLDSAGSGLDSDAIECINYAVKQKQGGQDVGVINASWGGNPGDGDDPALESAIQAAGDNGILFVAAAGNESNNNDISPEYPASSSQPNVVSVAATNSSDSLARFSNFGSSTVDVAAPGTNILSTYPFPAPGGYATMSGTSMATPFVSGLAALMLAEKPGLSPAQLKSLMVDSADKLGLPVKSGGRINAAKALVYAMGQGLVSCSFVRQNGVYVALKARFNTSPPMYGKRVNFYQDGVFAGYALTGGATSANPGVAVLRVLETSSGAHTAYSASMALARVRIKSDAISYTVTPPAITSISPSCASNGIQFTIAGNYFGTIPGSIIIVSAAGARTQVPPLSWSDTATTFKLDMPAGSYGVFVRNGMRSNAIPVTILPPSVSSLSPDTASAGTAVTVNGSYFGNIAGAVVMKTPAATAAITPRSWSDNVITFVTPPKPLGAYSIVVRNGAGRSSKSAFTIPRPSITRLSQTSAKAGTLITITGNYFGKPACTVRLVPVSGTVSIITPATWSDTSITFQVPAIRVGAYKLKVINTAGPSPPTSFTVTR